MESQKTNKMGTMSEGKLLINVSLPIIISMFVQALYNIVDSIFVAKLSESALTAVSLVFPVQNLMIGVAVGTGVGINSLLSRRLGEDRPKEAEKVVNNGIFVSLVSWLVFVVVGMTVTKVFFSQYIARGEISREIASMGMDYMYIVTIGSLGMFMSITLERFLQATGKSMFSMTSQITGAVVNVVLDPIMIFGLFGFPKMGVAGAALATIIGQFMSMFVALYLNMRHNDDINIKVKGFRPEGYIISEIFKVGLPSIIMQSISSLLVHMLNKILVTFGTTPVSVLGIYFKLQSFVFMPVFGMNNGMVSIVGYNFGAKKPKRIERTLKLCLVIAGCIMLTGTVLFWTFPEQLLGLFDAGPQLLEMGVPALKTISVSFIAAAIGIVLSGFFQAIGEGMYSLVISAVRQVIVIMPAAKILANAVGLNGVWYAFPIAEVVSLCLSVIFFKIVWERKVSPIQNLAQANQI